MSDRNKLIVLLVLLGVFLVVNFRNSFSPAATSVSGRPTPAGARSGSRIPDAEILPDQVDPSSPSAVAEAKRNIFQYGQAAQPTIARRPPKQEEVVPVYVEPPKPPPPVRFFGFSQGSAGGPRRVFLTNGEETFIIREGDVFMRRYRLVRVGNDNVEIEEMGGANRWVVPREQQ